MVSAIGCSERIALFTALAISSLRSMKDWLSMALTFTVICGAALDWVLFAPDWLEAGGLFWGCVAAACGWGTPLTGTAAGGV